MNGSNLIDYIAIKLSEKGIPPTDNQIVFYLFKMTHEEIKRALNNK